MITVTLSDTAARMLASACRIASANSDEITALRPTDQAAEELTLIFDTMASAFEAAALAATIHDHTAYGKEITLTAMRRNPNEPARKDDTA